MTSKLFLLYQLPLSVHNLPHYYSPIPDAQSLKLHIPGKAKIRLKSNTAVLFPNHD